MEPTWTKTIPSWLICDWFYAIFIINLVALSAMILYTLFLISSRNAPKAVIITNIVISIFGATSTLFYYLICDRALNPEK